MTRAFLALALTTLPCAPLLAQDSHDHAAHGHEHGAGKLAVQLDGHALHLRLTMSGGDLFGSHEDEHDEHADHDEHDDHDDHGEHADHEDHGEHADHDDHDDHDEADRPGLAEATALFARHEDFLQIDEAAGCELASLFSEYFLVFEEGEHEGHRDFQVTYEFDCESPEALAGITATAFRRDTGLERIDAVLVSPEVNWSGELTPDSPVLALTN